MKRLSQSRDRALLLSVNIYGLVFVFYSINGIEKCK